MDGLSPRVTREVALRLKSANAARKRKKVGSRTVGENMYFGVQALAAIPRVP